MAKPGIGTPTPTDLPAQLQRALGVAYRIEREVGQGGMSTVWLAEDLKHGRKGP